MAKDYYDEEADCLKSDYLYFVHDAASDAIKIGRTSDPAGRMKSLRNGNPNKLTMLEAAPNMGWQEAFWHEAFGWAHRHLEWFDANPILLDAIRALGDGGDWTDHVPPEIAPCDEIPELGEWREHMLDALDAYSEYVFFYDGPMSKRQAAQAAIFDEDFDGRCLSTRFVEAMNKQEAA